MQTDNQVKPDARTECDSTGSSPATGSVIPPGLYANEMGGWFEVRYSNLPDDPGYDQGAPGVGILWGREKWYVLANSKEHFWAQWPYSMFRNCTPVSPNKYSTTPKS